MKAVLILLVSVCFLPCGALAEFDHKYSKWHEFLKSHVRHSEFSSQVDYEKAKSGRQSLDQFVSEIESTKKSEYEKWSPDQQKVFLINAYNALTIKLILDNGVPKSIKKIGGWLANPWKKKFFTLFGEPSYLDFVEHELARKTWVDCRFHFAFNCASVGCPRLRAEPWMAENLDGQLNDAAEIFLKDRSRNRYVEKSDTLEISKIFDWYDEDFERDKKNCGSLKTYVQKYIKRPDGSEIGTKVQVKFLDYDWSLNNVK